MDAGISDGTVLGNVAFERQWEIIEIGIESLPHEKAPI